MFDLLLRRARLVDDTLTDIAIKAGKIAALGEINGPAVKTLDLHGEHYVSAGWIDSHVHCYPNSPIYHDEPDSVGINTGVTTVIDAGSTGADDVDDFYAITREAATEVYALLNISRVGLIAQNELANMANIDANAVHDAVKRHPDFIVGLKARMSSSVVGENGITPLERAKAIQKANGDLPLMVHIGNNPPNLDEIAELLTSGDIITHCYNGKPNRILHRVANYALPWRAPLRAACALMSGTAAPASALQWPDRPSASAFCRRPSAPISTAATGSTARYDRWQM